MKNIKELRNLLGDVMKDLKEGRITTEQARTISSLGQVIVNSAKVEVDFIRATKIDATDFISDAIIKPLLQDKPDKQERPKAEYSNNGHLQLLEKYGN